MTLQILRTIGKLDEALMFRSCGTHKDCTWSRENNKNNSQKINLQTNNPNYNYTEKK